MRFNTRVFFFLIYLISAQIVTSFSFITRKNQTVIFGGDKNETSNEKHQINKRRAGRIFVLCFKTDQGTQIVTKGTAEECVEHCWGLAKNLAFIKEGSQCRCLDNMNQARYTAMSGCQTPCVGDPRQNCGGENKYTMYETGYENAPNYNSKYEYTPHRLKQAYQGCYEKGSDIEKSRRLDYGQMTSPTCVGFCQDSNFNFGAVSGKTTCTCLYNLRSLRRTDEVRCREACPGMPHLNCGGADENTFGVYKTPSSGAFSAAEYKDRPAPGWAKPPQKSYDYFKVSPKNKRRAAGGNKGGKKRRGRRRRKKGKKRRRRRRRKKKGGRSKNTNHKKTASKKKSPKVKIVKVTKVNVQKPDASVNKKKGSKKEPASGATTTVQYTATLKFMTVVLALSFIII